MAGTVIVDTINSSVAGTPPVFQASGTEVGTLCRAWVNFNGTGTVAINGSFNVSSITDNGTGDYTINFTNAMPDANYSAVGMVKSMAAYGGSPSGSPTVKFPNTLASITSSVRINTTGDGGASYDGLLDNGYISIAVFR